MYAIIMECVACILTFILTIKIQITTLAKTGLPNKAPFYTAIMGNNDPSALLFLLTIYSISVITFSFAVSAFFIKGDHLRTHVLK